MLLHAMLSASRANGPGERAVVWLQGCDLGCRGCFNPLSHPFDRHRDKPLDEIAKRILACKGIEGVTFSGGEPMQQADSLLTLMRRLRHHASALSLGMFSGYTERELDAGRFSIWGRQITPREKQDLWQRVRKQLDFAVLGRFNYLHRGEAPLRSSRNQVLRLFSERYTESDFGEQLLEINIHGDGRTDVTGFPVLGLPW